MYISDNHGLYSDMYISDKLFVNLLFDRLFKTLKLRVVKKLWSDQGVKGDLIDQLIMSRILGLILLFTDSKIFPLLVILIW